MSVLHSSNRYVMATIVAIGVAVAPAAVAAPAFAHSAPPDCAETFNLFIPGTWETNENADPAQPIGMLRPIAEAIQRQQGPKSDIYFTPYMARAFDNGHTYADSKNTALVNARKALRDYDRRCPAAKFTITGYSQGADAAGDVAAEIGNDRGPVPPDRVLAVGLIADPAAGTKGETAVGPHTAGSGIADPRPAGMGKLSGRVSSICDPGDLYCSIKKGDNPLLGKLGSLLSKVLGNSSMAKTLTANVNKADLPGLAGAVDELSTSLSAPGGINLTRVRDTAAKLEVTLKTLAGLQDSSAADRLAAAPAGSAENNAGQVLTKVEESDLTGAATAVSAIADTATSLLGRGIRTLKANSPDAATLTIKINALVGQVAPLADLPAALLNSAAKILAMLKPTVAIDQTLDAVANVTALDFRAILDNLALLPQKVAAMDAQGAHQVAGALNNQFKPLVDLVASADLKSVAQVLSTVPNPQGYVQIATSMTSILSNVDVIRMATLVGQIQEIAWSVLEKLAPPPGQAADPAGAAAVLSGLLPVGLELASVATGLLTSNNSQHLDLDDLSDALAKTAPPTRGLNLLALIRDGFSAASFFASNAHINYGALVVDDSGRNAIQWLGDWMNGQIGEGN
ncbi:cutinase family protein [Nocardia sp. NPDC050175]|uniref:cutinase family protein n=1 Tax=Nocardia sp. NPDC050175 TaxID=3364317 RepID=UPI0037B87129